MPTNTPPLLISLGPRVRVDLHQQRLWRDGAPVELRPRAWQALDYLTRRAGQLVTTDTLLDALWGEQEVSLKTLANLMGELRLALGDQPGLTPVLQTVHRRGYRLMAPGFGTHSTDTSAMAAPRRPADTTKPLTEPADDSEPAMLPACPAVALVGRHAELATLNQLRQQADTGARQTAWVSGDAGLGKTALLDQMMGRFAASGAVACRASCLEQHSAREAFGPVLALLADLCAGPLAGQAGSALRRCAPTWLAQMPWLVQPHELPDSRNNLVGMGIGRMLREFGALVQTLCQHTALVLIIEDLHWADAATIDLLNVLATDRTPARLLLIGSYQPRLAAQQQHPVAALAARLQSQGRCQAVQLQPLDPQAVGSFILQRFGSAPLVQQLQVWAEQQSMGIPLYLDAALNHLVDSGTLAWRGDGWELARALAIEVVAEPLRPLIAARFATLSADTLQLLQAASVVGMQVPMQLLAAALGQDAGGLEAACNRLAQQGQFVRALAPAHWPDGSSGGSYAFTHDIYRRALYEGLPLAARQALHRRVAQRLEAGWGDQVALVAGQLAGAYARAAMPDATARVLEMTAGVSAQRFAYGATIESLQACLQQLALMAESAQRSATEVRVNLMLGNMVLNHQGLSSPLALQAFDRARELALHSGAARELVRAQLGATILQVACFKPLQALPLALETVTLAESWQPTLASVAHHYAGIAQSLMGNLAAAHTHQERALALQPDPAVPLYTDVHSGVMLHMGRNLCWMGLLTKGVAQIDAAVARSREISTPADLVHKLYWAAETFRLAGLGRAESLFAEVLALAQAYDLQSALIGARLGLEAVREPALRDTALIESMLPAYARPGDNLATLMAGMLLTETYLAQGQLTAAHDAWARARAVTPAGVLFDAELHRLEGELLAAVPGNEKRAEACFMAGLAIARQQQAGQHGLRCAISLFLLSRARGQGRRAHKVLAKVMASCSEGHEFPDLLRAGTLLDAFAVA